MNARKRRGFIASLDHCVIGGPKQAFWPGAATTVTFARFVRAPWRRARAELPRALLPLTFTTTSHSSLLGALMDRGSTPALCSRHNFFTERVQPVVGALLLLLCAPLVAAIIALSTLWGHLDATYIRLLPRLAALAQRPIFERLAARKGDGFIAAASLLLGAGVPLLCLREAALAAAHGFSPWRALTYNVLRIGPTYAGFAWAYTLAHKEAHAGGWLLNWVAGPFFGILPGTFTISHLLNHHKHHNSRCDVISTGGWRRDSPWSFCRYFVTWLAYALNVSTLWQMVAEGRVVAAARVAGCTAYYLALVCAVAWVSPAWAAASLGWALIEANILLAMVNWVWHHQIKAGDEANPFIVSTTIVRGKRFILAEEYHAVHHAAAGLHFSRHEAHFEENRAGYEKSAIMLQDVDLFEVFGRIVMADAAGLAALVHDPAGAWPDKAALCAELAARLRTTTW